VHVSACLIGPQEDLSGSWCKGFTMMHFAAMSGNLPFLQALVRRGVDFDVRLDAGITPLEIAMLFCRLPVVRFLLEQYRVRGREKRDMLRKVEDRLPVDASGGRQSLLFRIIPQQKKSKFDIKDEDKRAMVAFLVREAGADIWAEGHMEYVTIGGQHSGRRKHILFPLHTAAHYGIQQVLDFFLTECNMPVNTAYGLASFGDVSEGGGASPAHSDLVGA